MAEDTDLEHSTMAEDTDLEHSTGEIHLQGASKQTVFHTDVPAYSSRRDTGNLHH